MSKKGDGGRRSVDVGGGGSTIKRGNLVWQSTMSAFRGCSSPRCEKASKISPAARREKQRRCAPQTYRDSAALKRKKVEEV